MPCKASAGLREIAIGPCDDSVLSLSDLFDFRSLSAPCGLFMSGCRRTVVYETCNSGGTLLSLLVTWRLARIDVFQVGRLAHCFRCLVLLVMMVIAVDDWC